MEQDESPNVETARPGWWSEPRPPKPPIGCLVSMVLSIGGTILLMGLPGWLFLLIANWLYVPFGVDPYARMQASVLAAAMMVSMVWPAPIVPLSLWIARRHPDLGWRARVLVVFALASVGGVIAAFLLLGLSLVW